MSAISTGSLRLVLKRVFAKYFLELQSPSIADPTEAFATARAYLGRLCEQLGQDEFMRRLDDETTHLVGEVEQDLRYHLRNSTAAVSFDDLEERLRECFEHALTHLDFHCAQTQVE
jgi:hypothetical protein